MAGKEGVLGLGTAEQKAATYKESSSELTLGRCTTPEQNSATDGEQCTTVPQASEGGINEAVSEPQAEEAEYPDGYEYDDDYQYDAEYDDDYDYESDEYEFDYDYESDEYESDYDYEPLFEEHRPKVREVLLSFPEAANLEPHELDAAVERALEQSKPEYADVAAPGKIRLLTADIERALDPWRAPPPSIIYDGASKDALPTNLSLKMEELDKEFLPLYDQADDELEQFRAKVRRELIEKGYVEVDEDYYDKKDEFERKMMQQIQEEWDQKIDIRRFRVANNKEGICYYSEEHGGYI